MRIHFNSEEKQEAMSKELAALRIHSFRKPGRTETQALDLYLEKFDKLLTMALAADRHSDATARLL